MSRNISNQDNGKYKKSDKELEPDRNKMNQKNWFDEDKRSLHHVSKWVNSRFSSSLSDNAGRGFVIRKMGEMQLAIGRRKESFQTWEESKEYQVSKWKKEEKSIEQKKEDLKKVQ